MRSIHSFMLASEFECRRRNVDIAAARRQRYVPMRRQSDQEQGTSFGGEPPRERRGPPLSERGSSLRPRNRRRVSTDGSLKSKRSNGAPCRKWRHGLPLDEESGGLITTHTDLRRIPKENQAFQ
ncbi:hypothetical protein DBV15_02651 [Temnothorax longispinosus]|uniref:Uncharacterized protein n=1 Tax=Temnothorax longispinosus TaxID=300112 RepID=A0A4S2K9W4_9HYME|nr:hypothetical protein DBV15_02651 [Temnothorax longispinosus]